MLYPPKQQAGRCSGGRKGGKQQGRMGWRAQRVLQAGGLPQAGFCPVCQPESSQACKKPRGWFPPCSHDGFTKQGSCASPRQPHFSLCLGISTWTPTFTPLCSRQAPPRPLDRLPSPHHRCVSSFQPSAPKPGAAAGVPHPWPRAEAASVCPHVIQLLSYLRPAYRAIGTEGQRLRVYCSEPCLLTTFP